ncbi:801_t:CDS:2, partial [Entrophospora sp. SA101]
GWQEKWLPTIPCKNVIFIIIAQIVPSTPTPTFTTESTATGVDPENFDKYAKFPELTQASNEIKKKQLIQ